MTLTETQTPAKTKKTGEETNLVITAGQRLTIETSPGGAEILDDVVPAGKEWRATIGISIDEVDV